ncbi:MAG: alpha/beta fold hydrolase [Gammaproteobacteria bacterium]
MRPPVKRTKRLLATSRRYLRNAVTRRTNPRAFQKNDLTPHGEILREGLLAVRHYPRLHTPAIVTEGDQVPVSNLRHRLPLVLVPPLGVHAWVFDLLRERSMVRYFLARGFEVYVIDWGAPGAEDYDISLDTYVNRWFPRALAAIRKHSGQQELSLLGYCMGGLLSLLYLATGRDTDVRNLATIASPIDIHAGSAGGRMLGILSKPAMALHNRFGVRLDVFADRNRFHLPGWMVSLAFRAINPPGSVRAYIDMVRNLADTEYVTEYMSMAQWFTDTPDYPGGVVQDIAEKFAIANRMAEGKMMIGDADIDFRRVRVNLFAVAGDTDRIVRLESARHILDVVGSEEKTFIVGPGGHAGVFAGGRAPAEVWRPIADWLGQRSG